MVEWVQRKPSSPEDLKNILELEGGHMICQLCDAVMWVTIDIEGQKHLMRAGDIDYRLCPQCSAIHEFASR